MSFKLREPRPLAVLPEIATRLAGSVWASTIAGGLIVVLLVAGAITGFPHGWQSFVYSACALVSVLMLFLLQHTTNRESKAILIKLDELIHSTSGAREEIVGLEREHLADQEEVQERLHQRRGSD